jgi:hypothetical protein
VDAEVRRVWDLAMGVKVPNQNEGLIRIIE